MREVHIEDRASESINNHLCIMNVVVDVRRLSNDSSLSDLQAQRTQASLIRDTKKQVGSGKISGALSGNRNDSTKRRQRSIAVRHRDLPHQELCMIGRLCSLLLL